MFCPIHLCMRNNAQHAFSFCSCSPYALVGGFNTACFSIRPPPPSSAFQCLLANRMFDQDTSVQCLCHCFFFSFWAGWGREAPRLYCFICKLCKQKAFSALWQCKPNRSPSSFRALCFSLRDIPFAALIEPKWHYSDKCAAAASIAHH